MATLELQHIEKHFGDFHAVDGINLTVEDGEFLAILGPSGCGKSTTMRMIAGLETPTVGDIFIGDERVTALPPRLRNVAMVFQSYALYPHMSVAENIAFPLRSQRIDKATRAEKVKEAAGIIGVGHLLKRRPAKLSGGEKQRVALARALVRNPSLFIFDEPLSALDAQVRAMARSELRHLHDRTGITTVYVTHDQVEALGMGDRIAIMKDGQVRQIGTPQELYLHPADTFVASFLGTPPMNILPHNKQLIGFRPEYVHVENTPSNTTDRFALDVKIDRLEFLGSNWQIYAQTSVGGETTDILAQLHVNETHDTLKEGESTTFTIDRQHLRFFDANTGRRIDSGTL